MEEGLCYVPCNQKYWPYSDNTVDGFCNARMLKARYILSKEKHSDGDSKKKALEYRTWVQVLTAYQV